MSDEKDYLDIIEEAYGGDYSSAPWIEALVADVRRLRKRAALLEGIVRDLSVAFAHPYIKSDQEQADE